MNEPDSFELQPVVPTGKKAVKVVGANPKNPDNPAKARVTIILDEPADGGAQQFFGLNGQSFLIKFGEPVTVPRELLAMLDELVQTKTIPMPAGGFTERDFKRFPYRIVG